MNAGQGIMLYLVCMSFQDIPNVSFEFVSVKMYTLLEPLCLVVLDLFIKETLSTHLLVTTPSAEMCVIFILHTGKLRGGGYYVSMS